MAIRNVREIGDPVLNKTAKEVKEITPRVKELIEDMLETMYEYDRLVKVKDEIDKFLLEQKQYRSTSTWFDFDPISTI